MAKFFGRVGYGTPEEVRPGVWEDVIVERSYVGDLLRNTRRLDTGGKVLPDISIQNSISIVADPYATENFHAMKYVTWNNVFWIVSQVEVQYPRLLIRLGGVYNGPKPSDTP